MKIVKKNVYYCDFCNKRSLSGGHANKHEKHCTANPDRKCRLCKLSHNIGKMCIELKKRFELVITVIPIISDTGRTYGNEEKTTVKWLEEHVTLDEIRRLVDGCPACALAIIRQCKFGYHYFEGIVKEFNYQDEMRDYYHDTFSNYDDY